MTVEQRLEQLKKRLTVALTMMAMVAVTIQLSACGDDLAGPSAKCNVSDKLALAFRDLSGCDLRGADLRSARLAGANLAGADLRGVDLWRADLTGANLTGANLSRANLLEANLTGANLKDANLKYASARPELSAKQEEDACWSDCG